ncbi:MAG: AI-2E family transporter [Nitrospirae bacterium]|nr:AI-2E family transporter [Nitrospirota bacterium]
MTQERDRERPSFTDLRKLHHQMPRWVLLVLLAGVAAFVAGHIVHLLITLLIAAVIAYILSSAVAAIERLGIKRSVAVTQLFVLAAAFVVSTHLLFSPYLQREVRRGYARLPEFSKQIEATLLSSAEDSLEKYPLLGQGIRKVVDALIGPDGFFETTLDGSRLLTQATPFVMGFILVPFFIFFLLRDWPRFLKVLMDQVPPSYVETTLSVVAEMNILIGKYLRGLAGECFSVGVLASLGLWLIGLNNPISLGILSGLANVIPYLGPVIACSVACLIALMQFNSFDAVLNVVLLYVCIKLVDDLFLQPLLIGKSVELHPMLLVITIIIGENLFGIIGMILGVPVVTAAQKTAGILLEHRREAANRGSTRGPAVRHRLPRVPVRPI